MESNKINGVTRWSIAKSAVSSLVDMLGEKNTEEDPDRIRMALISFAHSATIDSGFTTSPAAIKSAMNSHSASGSTNWEFPLVLADSLPVRENAETYVIFISDGTPNLYISRGTVSDTTIYQNNDRLYHQNGSHVNYNRYGIWGTGSDAQNPELLKYARDKASAVGSRMVGRDKHVYAIGFGTGTGTVVQYMKDFITTSYSGTDETDPVSKYYQSATDMPSLLSAFAQIVNDMEVKFGQINVTVNDGVTEMTELNAKDAVPGLDHANDFKYYREGGIFTTKTEWTDIPEANKARYDSATGSIVWDLEGVGLMNGVTYSVEVVVWPNQASYDLITGLNQGEIDWDTGVTADQKKQIVRSGSEGNYSYSLRTNVDDPKPSITWQTYTSINGTVTNVKGPFTSDFVNPEPVPLTTRTMRFVKVWNDSLDPSQRPDLNEDSEIDPITFTIMKDGAAYQTITLPDDGIVVDGKPTWAYEFFISPGLKVDGITYNTGHNYTAVESDVDYHYELRVETIHPTLIDSNSTISMVGDGDTGEVADPDGYLTAYNDLKGGLNITKQLDFPTVTPIYGLPYQESFTINVTLKDADNNPISTDNGSNRGFGYRIIYGPYNTTPVADRQDYGTASYPYGRSARMDISSGAFTATINPGDTIRVTNIPKNTTYTVEETGLSDLYTVSYVYSDSTHVVTANEADEVTVKNSVTVDLLKVFKVDTGAPTTGLAGAKFDLYGSDYYSSGTTVNPDAQPLIQDLTSGDDGIFTAGYLAAGTYYLVETVAPPGYNLASPIKVVLTCTLVDGVRTFNLTYEQEGNTMASSGQGIVVIRGEDNEVIGHQITVTNSAGVELPMTGGEGTRKFTVAGALLTLTGLCLGCALRRRERRFGF